MHFKKLSDCDVIPEGHIPLQTNLLKRLDVLKWSNWHLRASLILGTGWAMDAFETTVVCASIANIAETFSIVDNDQKAYITSVWTFGGLFGALFFGYICDRFGRKFTFLSTLVMYSCFTCVTAISPTFLFFLIFRALTAIGVAAEYSAVTTSIAEFIPLKHRGFVSTLVLGMWTIGSLFASFVNVIIIPSLPVNIGWRVAFCFGAVSAGFALWARHQIPESPRWLISKGRLEEAKSIVEGIESAALQPDNGNGVEPVPFSSHSQKHVLSQLFWLFRRFPFLTLFACVLDVSQAFGGYGISSLLSISILPAAKIPSCQFPLFYFVGSVATLPGTLVTAVLMHKIRRKILLPTAYCFATLSAVSMFCASQSGKSKWVWFAYCVYSFFYTVAWNTSYPMYPELFPTQFRSTGIGVAVAVGRVGGFAGPILLNYIYYGSGGALGSIALVAAFFLTTCFASIPFAFFGVEGKDKSLEDCHHDDMDVQMDIK